MKTIEVDVIGVVPPCHRCQTIEQNARRAAEQLVNEATVRVNKLNIAATETISKYGVLLSPAIAINGIIQVTGKVPDTDAIEQLLREALTSER